MIRRIRCWFNLLRWRLFGKRYTEQEKAMIRLQTKGRI